MSIYQVIILLNNLILRLLQKIVVHKKSHNQLTFLYNTTQGVSFNNPWSTVSYFNENSARVYWFYFSPKHPRSPSCLDYPSKTSPCPLFSIFESSLDYASLASFSLFQIFFYHYNHRKAKFHLILTSRILCIYVTESSTPFHEANYLFVLHSFCTQFPIFYYQSLISLFNHKM